MTERKCIVGRHAFHKLLIESLMEATPEEKVALRESPVIWAELIERPEAPVVPIAVIQFLQFDLIAFES
jgi:hypothetical protein